MRYFTPTDRTKIQNLAMLQGQGPIVYAWSNAVTTTNVVTLRKDSGIIFLARLQTKFNSDWIQGQHSDSKQDLCAGMPASAIPNSNSLETTQTYDGHTSDSTLGKVK